MNRSIPADGNRPEFLAASEPKRVGRDATQSELTVVHVVSRIHEISSGSTTAVLSICESLAKFTPHLRLHCTRSAGQNPSTFQVVTHGSWRLSGHLLMSPRMKRALVREAQTADIVHNHGLWMMPNLYPGQLGTAARNKLICTPHGAMADWAWRRSYFRKRFSWYLGQGRMLRNCDCFHATAKHESEAIRRRGFKQPVAVIPNGIDLPELRPARKDPNSKQLLFLARIHPVKGLENLLRAWRRLQAEFSDWSLIIHGTGEEAHVRQIESLAKDLGVARVRFGGPVYDADKMDAYRSADLYVLPSWTENFGITIAEAMAHGLPVITTNATPWADLDQHRAGWCIDVGEEALLSCLREALQSERCQLEQMGLRGRDWMQRDFGWDEIGRKMLDTYQWLIGNRSVPEWVEV